MPSHPITWGFTASTRSVPLAVDLPEGPLPVVVSAVFVLFGLVLVRQGFDNFRTGNVFRNTPTERVDSVAMGRTKLTGRARSLDEDFEQPFRDGDCVYASWGIEEYTGSGSDASWNYVKADNRSERFRLVDDSSEAIVEDPHADEPSIPVNEDALPTGALLASSDRQWSQIVLSEKRKYQVTVGPDEDPPPEIAKFCDQVGISATASDQRRYTQKVIPTDHTVSVFGQATRDDSVGGPDHDVLIERDGDTGLFIITNLTETDLFWHYIRDSLWTMVLGLVLAAGGLGGTLYSLGL